MESKKDTSLNNVKLFFDDTFSSGVSIENVFDSLGGNFDGLVFFLQAFEVWLEKRKKAMTVQVVERCATCRWYLTKRCISEKGCERYSGWEPQRSK
jgi:hypothetical protein